MAARARKKRGGEGLRLTPLYYRIRRRLGMAEISAERIRKQRLLSPGGDAEKILEQEDEKRLRMAGACVLGGILLAVLAAMNAGGSSSLTLTRPGYGEDALELSVNLEMDGEPGEVLLDLESLEYTDEEWEEIRQEAWEQVRELTLAENEDWEHITSDLDFEAETGIPGVAVTWDTEDPARISYDGTVEFGEEDEAVPEQEVLLTATLSCGEREWVQEQTAVLTVPELTEEEQLFLELRAFLQSRLDGNNESTVELPGDFGGRLIRYLEEDPVPGWLFLLLGGLAALAFWLLPEQRRREKEKTRERALTLAYPELVSSLTVLMGAGLTVRGAWERMVLQYRGMREQGGEPQALYEEMLLTWNSLGQGVYEEEAYVAFGKRCGLKPYLRLGSLLETNLKKGSRGLIPLLRTESENAMEERLQLARKQGEETSTRLLLPMLLLFALVLAILVIPAFWSF